MPALTAREKRTIRLAAIVVSAYLALFFGLRGWKYLEARRAEYQQLTTDALRLKRELAPYENRLLLAQKLKEDFRFNPRKLNKATLVAGASAAIQDAAVKGGVQLGPIRETAARAAARELASMQLEGVGPVPSVMALLHHLETLGYPLVIDSLQINPDTKKPGNIKLSLTIVILDFDQWQKEVPRA